VAELTERQRQVLTFIEATIRTKRYAPTIRDICKRFGWASSHSAFMHLTALEKMGAITREKGRARTICVTPAGRGAL
jgi:repressor LexA